MIDLETEQRQPLEDLGTSPLKDAFKRKARKVRDRAIPITKKQKRSRWMPGARYMPFLWIQWILHPLIVVIEKIRERWIDQQHQGRLRRLNDNDDYNKRHEAQMEVISTGRE